jgi:hypothetical protein
MKRLDAEVVLPTMEDLKLVGVRRAAADLTLHECLRHFHLVELQREQIFAGVEVRRHTGEPEV